MKHNIEDAWGNRANVIIRDNTDDATVFNEVWVENVYRMDPVYVARGTVLDLGANVGAFSTWAIAAGARRVVSYEPVIDNFSMLEANTHGMSVERHLVGISNKNSKGVVHSSDHGASCWIEPDDSGGVILRALSDVLSSMGQIAVLKMDIEGGELFAFNDPMLDLSSVARIVMEVHNEDHVGSDWERLCGNLFMKIAEWGHLEVLGRPHIGCMVYGVRYEA